MAEAQMSIPTFEEIEAVRTSSAFAAIMECLYRDLFEAGERPFVQHMSGRDALHYARALALDHWKHPNHLRLGTLARLAEKEGERTHV